MVTLSSECDLLRIAVSNLFQDSNNRSEGVMNRKIQAWCSFLWNLLSQVISSFAFFLLLVTSGYSILLQVGSNVEKKGIHGNQHSHLLVSIPLAEPPHNPARARAVTGRRCSHSERGEDFLTGKLNFFTETAVTPERKVEKWFPR